MRRLLTRLRIKLNHTRLAHWLECLQGNHDEIKDIDDLNRWWRKCKHCPWRINDSRILKRRRA